MGLWVLVSVRGKDLVGDQNGIYRSGLFASSLGRLVYIAATLGCLLYLLEAWSRFAWNMVAQVEECWSLANDTWS